MLSYLLWRLYVSLLTLLGVSAIAFFLIRVVPGDTVTAQLGLRYSEAEAMQLRDEYGLDDPVAVQYARWLAGALRGDLGPSVYARQPVAATIAEHLPVTLELTAIALSFSLLIGIPMGIIAAVRRGGAADYLCSSIGVLGVSVPNFWLATLLILLFSYQLNWLPSGRFISPTESPLANLRHMLMPGFALGAAVSAVVMRMTRSSMLEVIGQDYIRTARAKGLPPRAVITRHALRNAMAPILTIIGIQTGYLLGGSVVIEMVFSLPGIGWLAYRAATDRDYFLLQGVILLIALGFITINLSVDLVYGWLDPRTRSEQG